MKDNFSLLPVDNGNPDPGVICAANESRFNEAHLSQPLTSYAVGWQDPENLDAALNALTGAPVPVPHRFSYREFINRESFLIDDDDRRSIGSEFKRVEFKSTESEARLHNHGLTIRLDRDQLDGDDPMAEERQVGLLLQRCKRNSLYRAFALLTAAATNTNKTWTYDADTNPTPNPDRDMINELSTAAGVHGLTPSRVIMGETAWNTRGGAYELQNNPVGYQASSFTKEQLKAKLMVDLVEILKARYTNGSARDLIAGAKVLMYLASDSASKEDPSNIKRFSRGGGYRVYRTEVGVKFIDLTVEYYELTKITSTLGIRQFTVS